MKELVKQCVEIARKFLLEFFHHFFVVIFWKLFQKFVTEFSHRCFKNICFQNFFFLKFLRYFFKYITEFLPAIPPGILLKLFSTVHLEIRLEIVSMGALPGYHRRILWEVPLAFLFCFSKKTLSTFFQVYFQFCTVSENYLGSSSRISSNSSFNIFLQTFTWDFFQYPQGIISEMP